MRVLLLKPKDSPNPTRFMKVGEDMLEQARTFYTKEIIYEGATIQECVPWFISEQKKKDMEFISVTKRKTP